MSRPSLAQSPDMATRLVLTRADVLAFRRRAGHLDARLPASPASVRQAAWAGLQDSMPRAAVLSLHARVEGVTPDAWRSKHFAQLWGPRYSAYVVPAVDLAVFSLGRLPVAAAARTRATRTAETLRAGLAGARMTHSEITRRLRVVPNSLRYAATTGTVLIQWDGARQPELWTVPPPRVTPERARLELARRYLHVFGPSTAEAFARWAGVRAHEAAATFAALTRELVPVTTPLGDAWLLAEDEALCRRRRRESTAVRLLPSGDAFYLLWGAERALLVPDARHRAALWTSRVWPGALLAGGEIVGTWRRTLTDVTLEPWRTLTARERAAVDAEIASLPLPRA